MTRFDELLERAKLIRAMPLDETARRRFLCSRCGRDLPRSCWVCDDCRRAEDRRVRDEALLRARQSIPQKFRAVRFGSPEIVARVRGTEFALGAARAAVSGTRSVVTITGPSSAGKTTLASAMLSEVIESGANLACDGPALERARFARFVDAVDISQARNEHKLGAAAPPIVLGAKNASVLVIDEFGKDDRRGVDVAKVIHDREAAHRLTIITTWMDQKEIAEAYDAGVARRLFQKATVIRLGAA